jgi:hypothetical protein
MSGTFDSKMPGLNLFASTSPLPGNLENPAPATLPLAFVYLRTGKFNQRHTQRLDIAGAEPLRVELRTFLTGYAVIQFPVSDDMLTPARINCAPPLPIVTTTSPPTWATA